MFRKIATLTASLAAILALGGCYSVNRVDQATAYSPAYVAYVSRGDSMPTEVFGNPFGDDQAADAKLISTLRLAAWHGSKPAHPLTVKDRTDGHRLVMVFNPTNKLIDGRKVCERTRFETTPSSNSVLIQAALCSRSEVISEARAEGPAPAGLDEEAFQGLLYRLLAVMLPAHEGSRNHECSIVPCS